jgi:hypothetical protein
VTTDDGDPRCGTTVHYTFQYTACTANAGTLDADRSPRHHGSMLRDDVVSFRSLLVN